MSTTDISLDAEKAKNIKEFLIDLKLLVKGKVLFANVLPVFTGFWLATHLTDSPFNWVMFLLVMLGSTFVVAGALMLNNWYEVDLDEKMHRTENRPTVTGNFSLNFVLWLGIITSIIGMIVVFFTTMGSSALFILRLVFICCPIYILDETSVYLEYNYW